MAEQFICPVCGFPHLDEAPYDKYGYATFIICPCCGIEFGYNDATKSHETLRMAWIADGCKWWCPFEKPPAGWNPISQLRAAGFSN